MLKSFLIIFFFLFFVKCNSNVTIVNKIESIILISDSLVNNGYCIARIFEKSFNSELVKEVNKSDTTSSLDSNQAMYYIFLDSTNVPISFVAFINDKEDNWLLCHKYYFNPNGNTLLYKYFYNYYIDSSETVIRKEIDTYFNDRFEEVKRFVKYEDRDYNKLNNKGKEKIIDQFDFNFKRQSCLEHILKYYKIKL